MWQSLWLHLALCRICSRSVISKHQCGTVFKFRRCVERLSRVINSPVVAISGHSEYICRPCNRKFLAAEAFIVLAKSSNEKQQLPLRSISSRQLIVELVLLLTHRCVEAPKRQTVAGYGRRLNFCR